MGVPGGTAGAGVGCSVGEVGEVGFVGLGVGDGVGGRKTGANVGLLLSSFSLFRRMIVVATAPPAMTRKSAIKLIMIHVVRRSFSLRRTESLLLKLLESDDDRLSLGT